MIDNLIILANFYHTSGKQCINYKHYLTILLKFEGCLDAIDQCCFFCRTCFLAFRLRRDSLENQRVTRRSLLSLPRHRQLANLSY